MRGVRQGGVRHRCREVEAHKDEYSHVERALAQQIGLFLYVLDHAGLDDYASGLRELLPASPADPGPAGRGRPLRMAPVMREHPPMQIVDASMTGP